MIYPKLKLSMANCEVMKPNNEDKRCNIIRIALLVWAFLRLTVSVLWTYVLILATIGLYQAHNPGQPRIHYVFANFTIFIQLIELGMIVTFIVAGFKKNARLYLVYYWYCILTLIIFAIAVTLCLSLNFERGRYFGELYIFYNIYDIAAIFENDKLAFLITSLIDFGFEILLIYLIKMLINNYRHHGNENVAGENV